MVNTVHVLCHYCGDSVPEHAHDSACHRQAEADRRLGALVRRLPPWWSITHNTDETLWFVIDPAGTTVASASTPEAALAEALGEETSDGM